MKSLVAGLCFISAQAVTAQSTCIPRTFAEEDIVASYEKINADKRAELAAVQKEYANFAEQVRTKKSRDNKIELTNAFADAAGIAYLVHKGMEVFQYKTVLSIIATDGNVFDTLDDLDFLKEDDPAAFKGKFRNYIRNLDESKKGMLRKSFGKKYEDKVVNMFGNAEDVMASIEKFVDKADDAGTKKALTASIKGYFNVPKRFTDWLKSLKDLSFVEQMKKTVFTVGKKIGFASVVAMVPLGAYVGLIKIQEQQRLVQLTAEQDKIMKQALLLELLLNQKSFAELAATRAQLNPEAVCPSA